MSLITKALSKTVRQGEVLGELQEQVQEMSSKLENQDEINRRFRELLLEVDTFKRNIIKIMDGGPNVVLVVRKTEEGRLPPFITN